MKYNSQRETRESKPANKRAMRWDKCYEGNENEEDVIKCWVATLAGNQGGFAMEMATQKLLALQRFAEELSRWM